MSDPVPPIVDASGALTAIAERFDLGGPVRGIEPLGQGNVNDTYLVRLGDPARPAVVLQRVNTVVFTDPEAVMANLVAFSEHVARRLLEPPRELAGRRWGAKTCLLGNCLALTGISKPPRAATHSQNHQL